MSNTTLTTEQFAALIELHRPIELGAGTAVLLAYADRSDTAECHVCEDRNDDGDGPCERHNYVPCVTLLHEYDGGRSRLQLTADQARRLAAQLDAAATNLANAPTD
ncbi:hypothetical protein [Nocardia cyriacigeorgica]|uniref:hypothetical protein n=1 Tax=Nocardia cyriacigeorgica TaxID=135487 RepID=UPI00189610CA|nr:hypothetical protein [Nocardia cyriacigeorgica]MBF6161062.1 hypothetical protein [Nocardia cyriacigeorgica]MBF6199861.1 hypothetical protein [Nocardia cyriacigeorgica]